MPGQNTPHWSKLDSANLLIRGMEALRPSKLIIEGHGPIELIPISEAAFKDASTPNDAFEQQKHDMALTCAVLYPIVVELVLKHIWEQEQGKTAEYIHNVHSLFVQLSPETRRDMEALYDQCCGEYKDVIDRSQQQRGAEIKAVDMANLEEALRWNEDAVKTLKYEMTPRGKSVPTGIIWSPNHMWILPEDFRNFAIELTRWTACRSFKNPSP